VSISGSLSFSFPYNEPHSLPCIGYGSALTSCHVRAILQHVSKITSVFQSLKFQPEALIPTVTTPIIKLVYPFIFHIKDKWSKKKNSLSSSKFLTKFQQSPLYREVPSYRQFTLHTFIITSHP
jgi:hypothetical protein